MSKIEIQKIRNESKRYFTSQYLEKTKIPFIANTDKNNKNYSATQQNKIPL